VRKIGFFSVVLVSLLFVGVAWAHNAGVTELGEGTVRKVYVKKLDIGAKGYVVADWDKGQVRVEVKNFPSSETGYEVFMFQIDAKVYAKAMFIGGNPHKGIVANPPPFSAVGKLIKQWKSLGDLKMDGKGNGVLKYNKGVNLFKTGLNMMMVFEKKTSGMHKGPEDFSKLMLECNGPLVGGPGGARAAMMMKIF
jgi:hypothetical protein